MTSTTNRFLSQLETPKENISIKTTETPNRFLSQIEGMDLTPKEGVKKAAFRYGYQPIAGILKKWTWPTDLFKLAASGASKEALMDLMENDPTINKQLAEQAQEKGLSYLPTQELAEELIEKHTGAALTAKTPLQKTLRLGSTAGALRPGGAVAKGTAAVVAPTVSSGLKAAGVPEEIAEPVGLLTSGLAPAPVATKMLKPSGMPVRRYEAIKKPTKVSATRGTAITEAVEKDFRDIGEKLLKRNKTYAEIKENPNFKNEVIDMFGKVENLAENIEKPLNTVDVQKAFISRVNALAKKGYMSSEFERSFNSKVGDISRRFGVKKPEEPKVKLFDQYGKSIPPKEVEPVGKPINAKQIVEQFRKNNSELGELFEPGKSGAVNRAKKEALLEHNRAIEDVIHKEFPKSEFSTLFKESNDYWSDLMNIDKAEEFINDLFKGKINYKNALKLFEDKNLGKPFEKLIGKEGFKDFKQLTKDLLSTEKSMAYLKKAENMGFKDLAVLGTEFVLHPPLAKAHALTKFGHKALQMLLDKPKYAITWKNALDNLKAGNYKQSEKEFKELDKAVKSNSQTSRQ